MTVFSVFQKYFLVESFFEYQKETGMAEVFWATRDLDGPPLGNHHFILIFLDFKESLLRTKAEFSSGQKFVTLAGHKSEGNLIFLANQRADVESVKEVLDPTTATGWSDFDMEKHKINPPEGGGWSLSVKIEELAYKYEKNAASSPVDYALFNENCSAWVNTLLKVAGISEHDRTTAGEFSGIDAGEEDLLDESLFE
jgi:hypothetical protein